MFGEKSDFSDWHLAILPIKDTLSGFNALPEGAVDPNQINDLSSVSVVGSIGIEPIVVV